MLRFMRRQVGMQLVVPAADRRRLMVWLAWLRTHPVCV
jgi:hypothetical protein